MNRSLIGLLNASPFFAARPFLTTLLIGLVARFTDIFNAPAWFVSNEVLVVLGLLAGIEVFGAKTELGRLLDEFTPFFKGVLNFALILILVMPFAGGSGAPSLFPEQQFLASVKWAEWGIAALGPFLIGGSVWLLAWLRSGILSALIDLDEEDDLGIQNYFSWIEDFWTISGTLVALFFPLLSLAIYGSTVIMLLVVQRVITHIQEKRKSLCHQCDQPIFATALFCPHCNAPNMRPQAVGLFGQATDRPSTDPYLHVQQLIARKRCPHCATRLPQRTIQQTCQVCRTTTFANAAELDEYLARLRQALPKTLAICFGLSFVPILGILPGVIYYRLAFIASMRGYLQRPTVFVVRLGLLFVNIFFVSIQWIPFLGALSIPIMCLTNYWLYRAMLVRAAAKKLDTPQQGIDPNVGYAL